MAYTPAGLRAIGMTIRVNFKMPDILLVKKYLLTRTSCLLIIRVAIGAVNATNFKKNFVCVNIRPIEKRMFRFC